MGAVIITVPMIFFILFHPPAVDLCGKMEDKTLDLKMGFE
jgi:hypothetical protein